jgi:hypothetical protein
LRFGGRKVEVEVADVDDTEVRRCCDNLRTQKIRQVDVDIERRFLGIGSIAVARLPEIRADAEMQRCTVDLWLTLR